MPVHEVFRGETVWQGDVEVFDLTGHPKAKRAYAWSHLDGKNDERTRFVDQFEKTGCVLHGITIIGRKARSNGFTIYE